MSRATLTITAAELFEGRFRFGGNSKIAVGHQWLEGTRPRKEGM